MGFSFERYTLTSGTVATPVFGYGTIALLESNDIPHSDQLVMSLNGNTLTFTTDYTIDEGAEEVTIVGATAAALVVGDIFIIQRDTKDDARYVDYTNNSAIDSDDLDLDSDQLFFLIQEAADKTDQVINLDLTTDRWNGLGKSTYNFGDAIVSDGLVTLRQMLSAVDGAETAEFDNIGYFSFSGDGVETDFTLTGAGIGFTDPKELLVHVAGVLQDPTTAYTVSGGTTANPVVEFVVAPADESEIRVRTFYGLVKAVLLTDIVDGGSIAPGSLSLNALDIPAGLANRFIVADAAGVLTLNQFTTSYITNLAATVQAYRLDQFAVPTANVSLNSNRITSLATPVNSTDAATKAYVDAQVAAAVNAPVNVAGATVQTADSSAFPAYVYTNSGSTAQLAHLRLSGGSSAITVEVKTASGGYVEIGSRGGSVAVDNTSVIIPAGGSVRATGSSSAQRVRLVTQSFI